MRLPERAEPQAGSSTTPSGPSFTPKEPEFVSLPVMPLPKSPARGVVQSERGEQSAAHLAVLAYNYYARDDDWTDLV